MSSTTKYSPTPQRDSMDQQGYTQAPPAYNDATSPNTSSDQQALLSGIARTSDDNIPDDMKYGGFVAEASPEIRMQFVRKVYSILTVQLLFTAALSSISFFSTTYKTWIQTHQWAMWTSLFGSIAFLLLTFWKRKSYPTNLLFLTGFTALEAYSISVIVSFYETRIVLQAVVITGALFVGLTLFACQSRYDFTSWAPYLFGAVWILVIFGFMAAFFPGGKTFELVYSGAAALIFSAYILVDTQMIMRHYHVEEEIAASISLYLDILNLFLAILRILNNQQNN